jgi:DNA polymerase
MKKIHLDFETRSAADISKGAFRYACDPSTEILVVGVSAEDGSVETWDVLRPVEGNRALGILRRAITENWEIHAFNSQFEWAILKYVASRQLGLPVPDINRLRCTAAVCRSAGLPPSLAAAAEYLKLATQKDKMGKALITKFSIPRKDGTFLSPEDTSAEFTVGGERHTAASAFQRFVEYCARDVETEMAVAHAMRSFELHGFMLDWFLADARLNDRGVPVDGQALERASTLIAQQESRLGEDFRRITGLSPTQTARTLEWLKERGYRGDSLDKASREQFGKDEGLLPEARRALEIRADLSFAATKKIPAMLACVMPDGFIRGSFLWFGAQKTGRWTSKTPQWQNMKKPGKGLRPHVAAAYQDIRDGIDLDTLSGFYGDPYEVIASLARYFVRFPGGNIFDADFSSVEAKILPMLIGCRRILDKFGTGEDLYTTIGIKLNALLKARYGVTFDIDRNTGKTIVLATQFQGGWHAVFTATGGHWDRKWCEAAVKLVRAENPEFQKAWSLFQDTFVKAMDLPGQWHPAGDYVSFGYSRKSPFPSMKMRLPSGRCIVLPYPERKPITMVRYDKETEGETVTRWARTSGHYDDVDDAPRDRPLVAAGFAPVSCFKTWEISYLGKSEGSVHYGRVPTYGGDLLQSCIAEGTQVLTRSGFKPIEQVRGDDCVWDGEEFVPCEGAIDKGVQECISVAGVVATPDHKFMVDNSWVSLSELTNAQITAESERLKLEGRSVESSDTQPHLRQDACGSRFQKQVYDILNCGPRNRFAILTDNGLILAHNCTQGVGADLLAHGVLRAEERGYRPFLLVHDQCLCPAEGGKDGFEEALCCVPDWFAGFPLEAEANEVSSYCKI